MKKKSKTIFVCGGADHSVGEVRVFPPLPATVCHLQEGSGRSPIADRASCGFASESQSHGSSKGAGEGGPVQPPP